MWWILKHSLYWVSKYFLLQLQWTRYHELLWMCHQNIVRGWPVEFLLSEKCHTMFTMQYILPVWGVAWMVRCFICWDVCWKWESSHDLILSWISIWFSLRNNSANRKSSHQPSLRQARHLLWIFSRRNVSSQPSMGFWWYIQCGCWFPVLSTWVLQYSCTM